MKKAWASAFGNTPDNAMVTVLIPRLFPAFFSPLPLLFHLPFIGIHHTICHIYEIPVTESAVSDCVADRDNAGKIIIFTFLFQFSHKFLCILFV